MAEDYKRPGWYPAPDGAQGERWWNGSGWSDSHRGGTAPAAAPAPPVAPPIVYSASNPAPQRPNPYAPPGAAAPKSAFTIDVRQNRVALTAFILGLIGAFGFSIVGPIAVILGLVGIVRARRLKAQGGSSTTLVLAVVGVVTGAFATIMLIVSIVATVVAVTVNYTY